MNTAMRDLDLAQLVKRRRPGIYQINAMLTPYETPEDAVAAIRAMPVEERLNSPNFIERYKWASTAYQNQLAVKRDEKGDKKRR